MHNETSDRNYDIGKVSDIFLSARIEWMQRKANSLLAEVAELEAEQERRKVAVEVGDVFRRGGDVPGTYIVESLTSDGAMMLVRHDFNVHNGETTKNFVPWSLQAISEELFLVYPVR